MITLINGQQPLSVYVALARRVHNVHETKEPPAMRVRIGGYTKKDLFLLQ